MRFVAEEDLLHFGVKGMRWGRRKSSVAKPKNPMSLIDREKARAYEIRNSKFGRRGRVIAKSVVDYNRGERQRINNKKEYKGKDWTDDKNEKLYLKYSKEHQDAFNELVRKNAEKTLAQNRINS